MVSGVVVRIIKTAKSGIVRAYANLEPIAPYCPKVSNLYSSQARSQLVESGPIGVTITVYPSSMSTFGMHSIPPQ